MRRDDLGVVIDVLVALLREAVRDDRPDDARALTVAAAPLILLHHDAPSGGWIKLSLEDLDRCVTSAHDLLAERATARRG